MNRINKILVIIGIVFIGCSEKEILPCNIDFENAVAYNNGRVYSGTCHYLTVNDAIWKTLTYKKGKLHKEIGYYLDNGTIEYIGFKNKDGEIDGPFERYFKNGNLELQGRLNNGYRTGKWSIYNEGGTLIEEIEYDDMGNPTTKY